MSYMKMTAYEIARRLGCTASTARSRLARRGVPGIRDGENPWMKYYFVDEDFFKDAPEVLLDKRAEGYMTADDLGVKFGCSGTSVRNKLHMAGIPPDYVTPTGQFMWKDRDELNVCQRSSWGKSPVTDKAIPVKELSKNTKYTLVVDGEGVDMVTEERKKKEWVGKRGRLVSHGHVVAEGVIESVSLCGVYLKGSTLRGDLNELELCEE